MHRTDAQLRKKCHQVPVVEHLLFDIPRTVLGADHRFVVPVYFKKNEAHLAALFLFESPYRIGSESEGLATILRQRWRRRALFGAYHEIDLNSYKNRVERRVSRRMNEMIAPLISIRRDDDLFIDNLISKSVDKYNALAEDKSMSVEANVITRLPADFFCYKPELFLYKQ